jgi:hypothetical protein
MSRCPNCGNEQAEVLLIDCTLPFGEVRDRTRYCYQCKQEARHEYAGCLPRVIMASSLSPDEKQKALTARRFTPDRRAEYPIAARIIDLAGPIAGQKDEDPEFFRAAMARRQASKRIQ